MFRPVRMCKVNVLILGKYVGPLTRALGSQGLVHLVDAVSQSEQHLLDGVDREAAIREIERLSERCNRLIETLGVGPQTPAAALSCDRAQIVALLDDVQARQRRVDERLQTLLRDSGLLSKDAARLRGYPVQDVRADALRQLSLLYIVSGRLAPALIPVAEATLGDQMVLLHGDQDPARQGTVLVLASRRNHWNVDAELARLGFVQEDLPEQVADSAAEEQRTIERRLAAVRVEAEAASGEMKALVRECGGRLAAARQQLRGTLAVLKAQQSFGHSTLLYCISGWVPRVHEAAVRRVVDEVTGGTGLVELVEAEEDERVRHGQEEVPVQFVPNRWLQPFQGLIGNFGAPRYNEVDPSLFVASSFVLMFGLMFGDVGQGLAVALLGLWLRRTRRPALAAWRQGGVLLLLCGLSAMAFGFCYGSVFGYENALLFKPLWLSPLRDVTRLLSAAIVVGIACISVAVVINIINRVRNRRWFESVFDKFGVLGIIFYWGALGIGLKAAKAGNLDASQFVLLVILPLALLFVREPLHNLLHRRSALHGDLVSFFLESCIEIMETVTAFLGSTVSFVRVGAFALSHAALCLAIYSVVDILQRLPGGGVWSAVVLVFGNLLVIFMEGMVAMIQGVRLEYYELFSKYFAGDGTLYHPFTLVEQPLAQDQGEQDT
jgi:V/A-type H+/Na+-transporting ATPase subunit I